MFGIGPTELAFFLVIVLLAVGPDKLPTFMRTVGKGLRQVRNASREFKDAIGLDDLMREGDPFRAPPVRPPRAKPVPVPDEAPQPPPPSAEATTESAPEGEEAASAAAPTPASGDPKPPADADVPTEAKRP
ncbi:MAG: twin-arginine translocase TatA/TatE family subunit [Deltaproteobacteria bacterium]|nr:MAG: twin-arginine translocase TatA/TatE family subunit [Deltaproteobacteria bacterium]